MGWKQDLTCVMALSAVLLIVLWVMLMAQGILPENPAHVPGMSWDLALNTAARFVTNTNWQAYQAEQQLSQLSACLGLTVQNFLSAAVGICVLFALIRRFTREKSGGIGNFWQDMTRVLLYILLPFSFVLSLLLVSGRVVQNFSSPQIAQLQDPVALDQDGSIVEEAEVVPSEDGKTFDVYTDNHLVKDAQVVTKQYLPMGPAASQIAIKQLGSNGGGIYSQFCSSI